jgi:hypothetical protein
MSKPLVVSFPHQLGSQEAKRRLQTGLEHLKETYAGKFAVLEDRWTGNHLDFRVSLVGQGAAGTIDIAEDRVTLSIQLPWFIAMMAEKAKGMIEKQGRLMLDHKTS